MISRCLQLTLFYLIFFSYPIIAKGQEKKVKINLLNLKSNLKVTSVPFDSLIVFDNRMDTSKIYTYENGHYPLETLTFDQPAEIAIKSYIQKAIQHLRKAKKILVINISELNIPNNGVLKFKGGKINNFKHPYYYTRDYIRFYADIYAQQDSNTFHKIAVLKFVFRMNPVNNNYGRELGVLMDELISSAIIFYPSADLSRTPVVPREKSYWLRDTVTFNFTKDTSSYRLDQINISAANRWSKAMVKSSMILKDGIYSSFEDFKENKITTESAAITFDQKDSVYRFSIADSARFVGTNLIWGIRHGGDLFVNIGANRFLKLQKKENCYEFFVPYTLPDMYTLLSLKENYHSSGINTAYSGNLLANLIAGVVTTGIDAISKTTAAKKINNQASEQHFRRCIIDMDSGDFIY